MAGDVQSSAGSTPGYIPTNRWPPYGVDFERDEKISELSHQVAELTKEINGLKGVIRDMYEGMGRLLTGIDTIASTFEKDISSSGIIIVEEMDKTTAKQKVIDFMKVHETSDIEEIHQNLRCDIGLLIEIIDELCADGTISGED